MNELKQVSFLLRQLGVPLAFLAVSHIEVQVDIDKVHIASLLHRQAL